MPSLNCGGYIDAALYSIWRQSIAVGEVIIIDSNSQDDTLNVINRHIAAGYPIKLIQSTPVSPAVARNLGIRESTGDLIAFLDADDLWPDDKLVRQVGHLDLHPGSEMVTGYICYFEKSNSQCTAPEIDSKTQHLFHVHVGACLYRKSCFSILGKAFDEDFVFGEDVDLLLRLRESGLRFDILRSIELYYRVHPNSMMSNPHPKKASDFRLAAYKSLQRRRSAGTLLNPIPQFVDYLVPPSE